jgi:uncharacterized protein (TIGR04255 family)
VSELDLSRLIDIPRTVLKHPLLMLALCQVKFSSLLGVTDRHLLAFQRSVQLDYPIATSAEATELIIGRNSINAEVRSEQRKVPQWQFTDRSDNWKIVLSQDFLTLEARAYNDFDDFVNRLEDAIGSLAEHIQPTFITRIGLRYINEIRLNTLSVNTQWKSVIRTDLLGPLVIPEFMGQASQVISAQQLVFRYPGNMVVRMHHGLFAEGTTVQGHKKPQDMSDPFYLLDFDVFQEFPSPSDVVEVDSNAIQQCVKEYHKVIGQLFRWSVTQGYISMLEG